MTLVPFIDMLTILVVFLLVHTSDVDVLPNTKNISIPESISDKKPRADRRRDDHQGRPAGGRALGRDAGRRSTLRRTP